MILLLLLACDAPLRPYEGLGAQVAMSARTCNLYRDDAEMMDWCLSSLPGAGDIPGNDLVEVCRRLDPGLARDRCLAGVARRAASDGDAIHCGEVEDRNLRHRCLRLGAVAALGGERFLDAMDLCAQAEESAYGCYAAVARARQSAWQRGEEATRSAEMALIFGAVPVLSQEQDLWRAYGELLADAGAVELCDELPPGMGHLSCLKAEAAAGLRSPVDEAR